jgi:hypothetical protein
MLRTPRHVIVAGISLLLAAATALVVLRSRSDTTNLAFWFETISDDARKTLPVGLPDSLSSDDMKVIETTSLEEIVHAFRAYPVSIVGRESALYHVRVVDSLEGSKGGSAESYVFPGIGGQGFVSFRSLAHGAIVYAPPDADREEIVAAIGRGIGRAAVHEFTHQLLGRQARIDASTDIRSYEYGSATRREQYYGEMRWDIAEPLLRERFGME